MDTNRLLRRQLRKYLGVGDDADLAALVEDAAGRPERAAELTGRLQAFVDAVHESYEQYERAIVLTRRSLALSSQELTEANDRLRADAARQEVLLDALRVAAERLIEDERGGPSEGLPPGATLEWLVAELPRFVNERRAVEQELIATREEALRMSKLKSDFVANMSHELRTPLNGVIGMMELLLASELSDDQREQVLLAQRSGAGLVQIINDILDFSKIEAGKLTVERVPFDVAQLLDDITAVLADQAQSKGIHLRHTIGADVPKWLVGDPGRIRQILFNLVGNAVKFTHDGGIDVKVSVEGVEPGGLKVRFEVIDTGIGISPERRAHIFDEFVQADPTTTRLYGGTGLGLTICKGLVDSMAGAIGVESNPGYGSAFWFRLVLPAASSGPGDGPDRTRGSDVVNPEAPCVLVVEDNPVNQKVAVRMLERLGCVVQMVDNGAAAVHALAGQDFDLVLMDCQMPVLDGYEATRRIRAAETTRRTPIVALTASALDTDRERAFAAGMDDHLAKPFDTTSLGAMVERWAHGTAMR